MKKIDHYMDNPRANDGMYEELQTEIFECVQNTNIDNAFQLWLDLLKQTRSTN